MPKLLGFYQPDGRFKLPSRNGRVQINDVVPPRRPDAVPPWIDLESIETVNDDLAPPARATQGVKRKSNISHLRDNIVGAAYGREQVLREPTHITTDSHRRLIIVDPSEPALHVLDGENSFRILGGPGHRMLRPHGVAVDDQDNIYVSDEKRAHILVYDPHGRYLRTLGDFHGESMFERPTAIAIDRKTRRLYVLDSPLNQLVVLDLTGRTVRRTGGIRGDSRVKLDVASEIAVGPNYIAVLDSGGSQVYVLDRDCNFLNLFPVTANKGAPEFRELGLAVDSSGDIYVSHLESATVRVYAPTGQLKGSLQNSGLVWRGPTGMWIDPANRLYISDVNNAVVEVFEATPSTAVH